MTKYREILRLQSLGFSERNIAQSCGVSRNTVAKVLKKHPKGCLLYTSNGVYQQYKGNICNRAFKCGSELPEYVALILRNGGSQSPDRRCV